MKRALLFILLMVTILPFALAHEGEETEQHSLVERIAGNPFLIIGVIGIIGLSGWLVYNQSKKTGMSIKKKKQGADKIIPIFIAGILLFAAFVLLFTAKALFFPSKIDQNTNANALANNQMGQKLSKMSLTSFDVQLANKFMDKDGDGKCDVCGMNVDICIESGQMQCNMDSKSTIGILQSQHIHADWKIYVNGKLLDLSDKAHMNRMRANLPVSSFIHVDSGAPAPEQTGDILHMHATGVPLWIFFNSIGLELPSEMKAYVNGKEISDYSDYVFEDLDKILITDGKGDLQEQLNSIPNFAEVH